MKFTNKLIGFIIFCVLSAMAIVLLGGAFSLRELTVETQRQNIERLIDVMDEQLALEDSEPRFAFWLPELLRAHSVVKLSVHKNNIITYDFDERVLSRIDESAIRTYNFKLKVHDEFEATVILPKPYYAMDYPFELLTGVISGVLIVLMGLISVIRRIKLGMAGAELLAQRSYKILNGDHLKVAVGSQAEWPKSTSRAFDKLIADLEDTKQERSRFDSYMRTNAFVDPLTGIGNRDFFLNQLEAMLSDPGVQAGTIVKIELYDLSQLNYDYGVAAIDEIVTSVTQILAKFTDRFIGSALARYRGDQFALLLPRVTGQEAEDIIKQLYKLLSRVNPVVNVECDELFYIGVATYRYSEDAEEVLENVDHALKIAILQGVSGWFVYEKDDQVPVYAKGTVKWRGLFERAISRNGFSFVQQVVVSIQDKHILGHEILPRMQDESGEPMHAAVFLPMAEKSGFLKQIDMLTLRQALTLLDLPSAQSCGVNLDISSLLDKKFMHQAYLEIMRLPESLRELLHIEIHEYQIVPKLAELAAPIKNLKSFGCRIVVDMVGQEVVDSTYIKTLGVNVLKIHPSLVRDLHKRQINRLAIRSILGGCVNLPALVIAVGVESENEWNALKELGVYGAQGYYCTAQLTEIAT